MLDGAAPDPGIPQPTQLVCFVQIGLSGKIDLGWSCHRADQIKIA